MTGLHARRASPRRRGAATVAALAVLGVGAWSGTALSGQPVATPDPPGASGAPAAAAPPGASAPPGADALSGPATTEAAGPPATPTPSRPSTPSASPSRVPTGVAAMEAEVVRLTNLERAEEGCPALTVDGRLTAAARAHSADMAAKGYFSHTSADGTTFDKRVANAGYRYSRVAENIAAGYPDAAAVTRGWMDSDGHRRNILDCSLRHIGVGLAYSPGGRTYWTQDFASPR